MAMPKNSAKRNEILRCAYRLFTESGYTKVFLRDIASEAGISKSLLQHYFPKKNDVIQSILEETLSISFEYVENLIPAEGELFLSLSVYTRLFWESVSKDKKWDRFNINVISHRELLESWIDIIYRWLRSMKDSHLEQIKDRDLKIALTFSITGGMELYLYRDELQVEVISICEQITTSFMEILNCQNDEIRATLKKTHEMLTSKNIDAFTVFCEDKIQWLNSP